jgi:hypothetical protein
MKMMKHIQTWLLITLLALSANGVVNAKAVSGYQNLSGDLHQSQTVLNTLLHQGLEQVSTMLTSESPLATKGANQLCFVEGTPVHTKDGLKPIEEIEVGDLVASKNDKTGEVEWKPVVELFRNKDKEVLNIGFAGPFGKLETLGVTAEHPFWVEGKGWTNAGDLAIDDEISTLENGAVKVASIASDAEKHTTYNFEVEDFHTYFVGESALWVHNVCWNPLPAHKLWGKGKLGSHFTKHGDEFGAASANQYSALAQSFGKRTDVLSGKNGAFIYKFEPSTNTVFVGTASGRATTFYKWDGRADKVVDFFKNTGQF